MRWVVDVATLGKTDGETLHVDADSWQKALQAARAQRGEAAPMSGFSIELLDDGCRAIDPLSRLRYEVRRAPDLPATAPTPAGTATASTASISHPPPVSPGAPSAGVRAGEARGELMARPSAAHALASTLLGLPPSVPRPDLPPNVPSQVIFKREHEANDAVRLTYREYVFLVPKGTSEEAAEALLHAQLELVLASLARVPPGKLVNLAVFDVAFRGRPPVSPLATLMWKDWRGAAVVEFPRRRGFVARTSALAGVPAPALTPPEPVAKAPVDPPAPVSVAPPAPVSVAPPAPVSVAPPTMVASVDPPAPALVEPSAPVAQADPARNEAPLAPAVRPPAAAIDAPPPPFVDEPPAPVIRTRARGEDLIADLFDSMHELHFLRDALEGGSFCLALAMEKMPSQTGIVHLYDIDRREFVVTSTRGVAASALLLRRHTEADVLLAAAMRKRRAVVIADAKGNDAASLDRYVALGGARSLMVAPVMQAGRFLGAIELLNPLDGQPYTEAEGNALMYIADQFAVFVAARGVVTDPARITR
jgi:GAF domain